MATTAVVAELAIVDIVGAMAIRTTAGGLLHRFERTAMASFASDVYMHAIEREIRLCIVIKQPQVPGDGVMACTTI